jgi:hypothetical protein
MPALHVGRQAVQPLAFVPVHALKLFAERERAKLSLPTFSPMAGSPRATWSRRIIGTRAPPQQDVRKEISAMPYR